MPEIMLEDSAADLLQDWSKHLAGPQEGTTFTTLYTRSIRRGGWPLRIRRSSATCVPRVSNRILAVKRTAGLADVLRGTIAAATPSRRRRAQLRRHRGRRGGADFTESLDERQYRLLLWSQAYDLVLLDCPACKRLHGCPRHCEEGRGRALLHAMGAFDRRRCRCRRGADRVLPAARSWPWS